MRLMLLYKSFKTLRCRLLEQLLAVSCVYWQIQNIAEILYRQTGNKSTET